MVAAILCGVIAGVVGFLPLLVGLRLTRKVTATSNFGHMSILIISLIISFVIMFACAIACVQLARDVAMPFVLAEAVALSVTAVVFGVIRQRGTGGAQASSFDGSVEPTDIESPVQAASAEEVTASEQPATGEAEESKNER